jgi:Flp pilus assembly protein TadD
LLALGDAPGMEAVLRGEPWREREFLRAALLAHAYRAQGRVADFSATWRLALIATGSDRGRMLALLARADDWRWAVERHEVIWKLFGLEPENTTIQDALIRWERHRGDTPALRRIYVRIVEVSPADEVARNNLAYTSLLIDVGAVSAGLMAAELAAKYPENPYYATTLALALHRQGDDAGALAVLDRLSLAQRSEPVRALLRARCLASLGQFEPAQDLLDGVVLAELLPEERKLAAEARVALARHRRAAGNQVRLLARDVGADAAGSGWLDGVDAAIRAEATTDMRLAESLQIAGGLGGAEDFVGRESLAGARLPAFRVDGAGVSPDGSAARESRGMASGAGAGRARRCAAAQSGFARHALVVERRENRGAEPSLRGRARRSRHARGVAGSLS